MNNLLFKIFKIYKSLPLFVKSIILVFIFLSLLFIIPETIGYFIYPSKDLISFGNIFHNWFLGVIIMLFTPIAIIELLLLIGNICIGISNIFKFIKRATLNIDNFIIKQEQKLRDKKINILK